MEMFKFTALISIQFMMRNTSPIGWVPLLLIKLAHGAWYALLVNATIIAVPILFLTMYLDSLYYSSFEDKFEWVLTGYNFL